MVYANGDYYEGEWEAGLRQGEGVLVYANGNVYEGQWEGDNKEGKGRFSHASGVIQVFFWHTNIQQHPFQDGFWVADCLKCSVLTHRGPSQSDPDPDKFSYVDIKDSGYLPLLGLQVNQDPSLSIFIRTIYVVLLITNITIRIQEGFYARQNTKLKKHLQCFLLTDRSIPFSFRFSLQQHNSGTLARFFNNGDV